MNRTATFAGRVYCVDLAKNKFQLHTYSAAGERLAARTLSRSKFDAFDAHLKRVRAQSPMVQRLDGIFGVGHVTATAFVGEYSHSVARFADEIGRAHV